MKTRSFPTSRLLIAFALFAAVIRIALAAEWRVTDAQLTGTWKASVTNGVEYLQFPTTTTVKVKEVGKDWSGTLTLTIPTAAPVPRPGVSSSLSSPVTFMYGGKKYCLFPNANADGINIDCRIEFNTIRGVTYTPPVLFKRPS